MTVAEMEKRLVVLGDRCREHHDKDAQREYQRLYPIWRQAKAQATLALGRTDA